MYHSIHAHVLIQNDTLNVSLVDPLKHKL